MRTPGSGNDNRDVVMDGNSGRAKRAGPQEKTQGGLKY